MKKISLFLAAAVAFVFTTSVAPQAEAAKKRTCIQWKRVCKVKKNRRCAKRRKNACKAWHAGKKARCLKWAGSKRKCAAWAKRKCRSWFPGKKKRCKRWHKRRCNRWAKGAKRKCLKRANKAKRRCKRWAKKSCLRWKCKTYVRTCARFK